MSLTTFAQNERLRMQSARALDLGRAPLRAAAPVVDLLVRLWSATYLVLQIFSTGTDVRPSP